MLRKGIKRTQVIIGVLGMERLDRQGILQEEQAGFRVNRSCMDNVFMLNELVQGRLRENKLTYTFFSYVQKAYDTVWCDGLWLKLWDLGVKGCN